MSNLSNLFMARAKTLTVIFALTVLAACAMPRPADTAAASSDGFSAAATALLDDTGWKLIEWKEADGAARPLHEASKAAPTLMLSTADGKRRASGFSGCNRYMGSYTLENNNLHFGPLAGTRMACLLPQTSQLESDYLNALEHIARTSVQMKSPQHLQIVLDNGATLVFSRVQ